MNIIIVCGSRNLLVEVRSRSTIKSHLHKIVEERNWDEAPEIWHGGSGFVDKTASIAAEMCGFKQRAFLANWKLHGPAAGPIRNREMVEKSLEEGQQIQGLAYWDGKSRGTANCVCWMNTWGIPVEVYFLPLKTFGKRKVQKDD